MALDWSPTRIEEATSEERAFIENLLNQRANFTLLVLGLALAASATLTVRTAQLAVLVPSLVLCALLAMATSRAQWKLDILIAELPEEHPAKTADAKSKAGHAGFEEAKKLVPALMWPAVRRSRRGLVGYWVPWLTVVALATATGLAALGRLEPASSETTSLRQELTELSARTQAELASLSVKVLQLEAAVSQERDSSTLVPGRRPR